MLNSLKKSLAHIQNQGLTHSIEILVVKHFFNDVYIKNGLTYPGDMTFITVQESSGVL